MTVLRKQVRRWEGLYRQWFRVGSRNSLFLMLSYRITIMSDSDAYSESSLVYVQGDLFTAPDHSILVHACNTLGSWESGIAFTFRQNYPAQFAKYQAHCETHGQALVGTCLLIPGERHDIACLFTSRAYGKDKDKPADILAATRKAVKDLEARNTDKKALHAW